MLNSSEVQDEMEVPPLPAVPQIEPPEISDELPKFLKIVRGGEGFFSRRCHMAEFSEGEFDDLKSLEVKLYEASKTLAPGEQLPRSIRDDIQKLLKHYGILIET